LKERAGDNVSRPLREILYKKENFWGKKKNGQDAAGKPSIGWHRPEEGNKVWEKP